MTEKSTRCVRNGRFSSGYSCSTDHFTPCAVSFSDLICILVFYIWIRKVFLFALLAIFWILLILPLTFSGDEIFQLIKADRRALKIPRKPLRERIDDVNVCLPLNIQLSWSQYTVTIQILNIYLFMSIYCYVKQYGQRRFSVLLLGHKYIIICALLPVMVSLTLLEERRKVSLIF